MSELPNKKNSQPTINRVPIVIFKIVNCNMKSCSIFIFLLPIANRIVVFFFFLQWNFSIAIAARLFKPIGFNFSRSKCVIRKPNSGLIREEINVKSVGGKDKHLKLKHLLHRLQIFMSMKLPVVEQKKNKNVPAFAILYYISFVFFSAQNKRPFNQRSLNTKKKENKIRIRYSFLFCRCLNHSIHLLSGKINRNSTWFAAVKRK